MTTENRRTRMRAAALLISLALAVSAFAAPALPDDQDLIGRLPGQWTYAGEAETAEGEAWEASLVLSLGADGTMTLDCADPDEKARLYDGDALCDLFVVGRDEALTIERREVRDKEFMTV